MQRRLILFVALGLITAAVRLDAAEPQLAHMVFFTLAEDTPEHRDELVAACQKYLSGHQGAVYFSAGSVADDLVRDVNDREFHVALHLVFVDKAAHDKYQTHPRHLAFIETNKHLWSGVRVFDSYLQPPLYDDLPAAASGFAGMVRGSVAGKQEGAVIVTVSEVTNVWRQSKAENPQSLIGRNVLVTPREAGGRPARFVQIVQVGETLHLDVGEQGDGHLVILELTAEQRRRVKE